MATKAPTPAKKGFPERKPLTAAEKKARDKARAVKMAAVTFEAPEDLKTLSIQLHIRTMHDGTIHPGFKAEAIKGRWDNVDARRFDMAVYDPVTAAAIIARLSAATANSNPTRRLPPDSVFRITLAARSDKDGNVGLSFREIAVRRQREGKKPRYVPLERDAEAYRAKDPEQVAYARIKRSSRFLRGAFVMAQPIPGIREYQQMESRLAGAAQDE